MAAELNNTQLTPLVLNQLAPAPVAFSAHFANAPTAVKIHMAATNSDLVLAPDATGKVFSGTLPPAALLTGLTVADVSRAFIGHLLATDASGTSKWNLFGDVLTDGIPLVAIHPVNAEVQFSDHLVNIRLPTLADKFSDVHLADITQKFFAHFDDEYDFLQIIFARSYPANRGSFCTHNTVQGIGLPPIDNYALHGSAGRLQGLIMFPIPMFYDGISPSTFHEMGHRWMVALNFPPLTAGIPHWPLSDLAADIMGYSIVVNGQPEGGRFDFTLQPIEGDNYQMVPDSQPKTFSDLSQYLMGLRPANQVAAHFVFDNQAQATTAGGVLAGPVTSVGVSDVIAHFGARVPDFANSQKRFRVAAVLVTKSALAPVETMRLYDFFAARSGATTPLAYTDGFIKATANPFALVTGGVGRIDPRIKRRILVDASRDGGVWWFPQSGPFHVGAAHQGKALADHLRELRHTVRELPRPTTITPALLANFDIVIRIAGKGPYTAAELAAYDAWVSQGGGLLLCAEHHASDGLAAHFGLQFSGITRGQQVLSKFAPHPVTVGVGPIPYGAGSGLVSHPPSASVLGWLSASTFLDLDNDGVKDPGESSAPAGLGVMPWGRGKVVFSGDANLWEKVPQPLLRNTLRWFATY